MLKVILGKRYYSGCENIDDLERLAINRAKKIFVAEHVNVQPHSGSSANIAVYVALLKPRRYNSCYEFK